MDKHSEWIDFGQLQDSSGGDEEFSRELIETYMTDAAKRMQAIREGILTGDMAKAVRESHTLKGSSGNIGAKKVAEICRKLEREMSAKSMWNCDSIMIELETAIEKTGEEFKKHLS